MALSSLRWFSQILGRHVETTVLLPDVGEPPFAAFYLLHGRSDDHSCWLRRTRLEVYAAKYPLIIVMPDGERGFYTDNDDGPAWAKHIGEELPTVIERHFRARPERGARAIGGLSMGGYGALRVGLAYAERFCSVNSHSGAMGWGRFRDGATMRAESKRLGWDETVRAEMRRVFGSGALRDGPHDPLWHASRAKRARSLPALLVDCGTEDFLIESNREFSRDLTKARIPHVYREYPGAHDWDYWDLHVREALEFHAANLGLKPTA
jgi:S-formylglutathione hydrolase FrmB